jgi:hypothetical protein
MTTIEDRPLSQRRSPSACRTPQSAQGTTTRAQDDPDVCAAYGHRVRQPLDHLPQPRPFDHTMAQELDVYVEQRLPVDLLDDALSRRAVVQVHGIYPSHVDAAADSLQCRGLVATASRRQNGKSANYVRPEFYWARDAYDRPTLVVLVPPGNDYVLHYASLIRHFIRTRTSTGDKRLVVWRYPDAERTIADWTDLSAVVPAGANAVVLGNVDPLSLASYFAGDAPTYELANSYYTARCFPLPGGRLVVFLSVHYSYWGSISAVLARRCCELGVDEIIYVGKLGTLASPFELYSRLFVPSRYGLMAYLDFAALDSAPPNNLLQRFPTLDTGLHVSVPTVLEEDCRQREVAAALGVTSIDNELAHMAAAVAGWNDEHNGDVSFSGLHYATDYLRGPAEIRRVTAYSLANGRTDDARRRRAAATHMISHCLHQHLIVP